MSVQNYFTNYGTAGYNPTQDTNGVPENWALQQTGVTPKYAQQTVSVLAADDNGSTYLLMKDIPADSILARCDLEVDAMAGATSYSIGIYDATLGTATNGTGSGQGANCYMNAVDIHTGSTFASPINGIQALTHEAMLVPIWSLAGDTLLTKKGRYDIVLTANTVGTAAGSITARMFVLPNG